MNMEQLTVQEAHIILHASGLSQGTKLYRSHYCIGEEDPALCKLVADGYFSGPHKSGMLAAGAAMFYLTDLGKQTASRLAAEFNSWQCRCEKQEIYDEDEEE